MKICPVCGKEKPSYQYGDFFPETQCLTDHSINVPVYQPSVPYQVSKPCDHCFCMKAINDPTHKQCCNCGNRQKISDMEMNIKKR